jgi:hypothetical protein
MCPQNKVRSANEKYTVASAKHGFILVFVLAVVTCTNVHRMSDPQLDDPLSRPRYAVQYYKG